MMKVLLLTPDLEYSGTARQLSLLALGLSQEGIEPTVGVLGREGPLAKLLRRDGVRVEVLRQQGRWDLRGPMRLRRLLVEMQPDLIHAWRPQTLRFLTAAAPRWDRALLVSKLFAAGRNGPSLAPLDRWLLRRADRILAAGPAEVERCRQAGLAADKLTVVPPGVRVRDSGIEANRWPKRFLLCIGPLEAHKGHRNAIWAFDVLSRLYPGLQLILAGTGRDRPRLEGFVNRVNLGKAVHFVGPREDLTDLLTQAALVWVPSLADAGMNVALEAMAASRPVVASRLPGLAEVVAEGETGFLVPPGDTTALARRSRLLLDDEALGRCFGEAGRQRACRRFAATACTRAVAEVYRQVGT
jgi:glycosyltransferase involved in cell wall biosynthesis